MYNQNKVLPLIQQNDKDMTNAELLNNFKKADKKVSDIENAGGVYMGEGYGSVESTKEYDKALEESQSLYMELQKRGINPFA